MIQNRQLLAKYFADLGFTKGAEIGVCRGQYSRVLLESIPGLTLYGVDPWYSISRTAKERGHRHSCHKQTLSNLASWIESGQFIILRKFSMEALADIPDESLDFVFIDGDHRYEFVKDDIAGWEKKVRKGGIVSGHDYYIFHSRLVGVVDAVNDYVKENNIDLLLTARDPYNPDRDSRRPCWYFIK